MLHRPTLGYTVIRASVSETCILGSSTSAVIVLRRLVDCELRVESVDV